MAELVKGLQSSRAANASSSGGDMATFAELSQIANDAGQPELVYKLMELSTASAVWNARGRGSERPAFRWCNRLWCNRPLGGKRMPSLPVV